MRITVVLLMCAVAFPVWTEAGRAKVNDAWTDGMLYGQAVATVTSTTSMLTIIGSIDQLSKSKRGLAIRMIDSAISATADLVDRMAQGHQGPDDAHATIKQAIKLIAFREDHELDDIAENKIYRDARDKLLRGARVLGVHP